MSPPDTNDADAAAMLRMYGLLREEILQSNGLQQRIVLGLATFVGLVFSLVFSGVLAQSEVLPGGSVELLLGAVVPIVAAAAGIWLVEQSRVMMAGNYLYLLEHKIHDAVGGAPMSWENWLRRHPEHVPDGVSMAGDGEWNDPQDIYNLAYKWGYVLFFVILAVFATMLYFVEVVAPDLGDLSGLTPLDVVQIAWGIFLFLPIYFMVRYGRNIIYHDAHSLTAEGAAGSEGSGGTADDTDGRPIYPVIRDWEQQAFDFEAAESEPTLADVFEEHEQRVDALDLESEGYASQFEELLDRVEACE
jgi:hypothetical protein